MLARIIASLPVDALASAVHVMPNRKRKEIARALRYWDLRTGRLKVDWPPVLGPPPPKAAFTDAPTLEPEDR